jgi:para-nitrobenzyl esterase
MRFHPSIAAVTMVLTLSAEAAGGLGQQPPALGHTAQVAVKVLTLPGAGKLVVTSPAFGDGQDIPFENTQYRGNIFPGLTWTPGPEGTRSYAVIVQGESLGHAGSITSIHLTLFDISAGMTSLPAGMIVPPAGATYGENIHGVNQRYAGPHTHTAAKSAYHYQVFALDTVLRLDPAAPYDALMKAMTGHVLASGDLVGVSARDPEATDTPLKDGPRA